MERVCSECSAPLGPHALPTKKTCSKSCRDKRARRIKRQQLAGAAKQNKNPQHLEPLSAATRGQLKDATYEVMKEELRPVVREALTDDVLRGVERLITLTPRMIQCIEEDLHDDDKTIRQRAYTLLARYTLGNQSVAPPPQDPAAQGMTVVFNLPRPGDTSTGESGTPQDVIDLKQCQECTEHKPPRDFEAGSDRCKECHEKFRQSVLERYGETSTSSETEED